MRIGLGVALIVVLASGACVGDASQTPPNAYVGRAACAECHATEVEAWTGSHHDLAMQEVNDETVLGDFDGASFTHGSVVSTFYRDGTGFFVSTEGRDGEIADFEIAYTFGVTPLQQYLVSFPDGRYQMLGIAWDSRSVADGGQRWFHLYPDADTGPDGPFHWTRPAQNWNTMCAECHSTNLDKGFDISTRTFETTWSEVDVSCEACHGPGERHVNLARANGDAGPEAGHAEWGFAVELGDETRTRSFPDGATTATLTPSPSARAQIESCAVCHARRAQVAERHAEGSSVLDTYEVSLLREDLYHADGQILGEVYAYGSFVQSKMYAAGVTCSDCHEPHGLRPRADGNALCTQCHLATHYDDASHHFHETTGPGARCVECHMPETTYMVVDPRRDHSIRVPRPDLSASIGVPNACNQCHSDRSIQWAVSATEAWFGSRDDVPHYGTVIDAGRSGDPTALQPLAALAGDSTQPAMVRGTALSLLGGYPGGTAASAIRGGLASAEPLVRLGAVQGLAALDPSTVPVSIVASSDTSAAVRIQLARLLASRPRQSADPGLGAAVDSATAHVERAQNLNADQSSSWVALGDLYASQLRVPDALAAYQTALQLDSTDLVASLNLADLLRTQGRDDAGADVLVEAMRYREEEGGLLHAMGLLRIRQGAADEAVEWLARAAAASPGNPRLPYVHAVALASAGNVAEGVDILEAALVDHPFDRDTLAALAAYTRDLGRLADALRYAERLLEIIPGDAGAQRLVAELRAEAG